MTLLENVSILVTGKDLTISDINFMRNAFDNCTKITDMIIDFTNTGLVDLTPLENTFGKLKKLLNLNLLLNSNFNVKSISFLENAF